MKRFCTIFTDKITVTTFPHIGYLCILTWQEATLAWSLTTPQACLRLFLRPLCFPLCRTNCAAMWPMRVVYKRCFLWPLIRCAPCNTLCGLSLLWRFYFFTLAALRATGRGRDYSRRWPPSCCGPRIPLWMTTAVPLEFYGRSDFARLWVVSCIFFLATVSLSSWFARIAYRLQEAVALQHKAKGEKMTKVA
ncbi:putative mannosyltransferase [Trypanosoma cruzi]|uniref:GPI mannosyltransferase 1 n=1 Tax=Trypanosoma cruzi TaxID=5693 RepID=A0A2V2VJJ1_TRYCR|nr:putative mannosyltransferase [Trypanosoma cruzi]